MRADFSLFEPLRWRVHYR